MPPIGRYPRPEKPTPSSITPGLPGSQTPATPSTPQAPSKVSPISPGPLPSSPWMTLHENAITPKQAALHGSEAHGFGTISRDFRAHNESLPGCKGNVLYIPFTSRQVSLSNRSASIQKMRFDGLKARNSTGLVFSNLFAMAIMRLHKKSIDDWAYPTPGL